MNPLTPSSLRNIGRLITLWLAGESATLSLPMSSGTSPALKQVNESLSSSGLFPFCDISQCITVHHAMRAGRGCSASAAVLWRSQDVVHGCQWVYMAVHGCERSLYGCSRCAFIFDSILFLMTEMFCSHFPPTLRLSVIPPAGAKNISPSLSPVHALTLCFPRGVPSRFIAFQTLRKSKRKGLKHTHIHIHAHSWGSNLPTSHNRAT